MKNFFNKCKDLYFNCVDYLKANKTLAWVLIGVAALIVLVIVVSIIASCAKRSKKKKAEKSAPTAKTATASVKSAPVVADEKLAATKADKEKAAAEEKARRMEVLARLEAEEKAAEAEELAKKQAEEKASAEKAKAPAKKATPAKPVEKTAQKPAPKTETAKATAEKEEKQEKAPVVKKTATKTAKKAEPKAEAKAESKPVAKKSAPVSTPAPKAKKETEEEKAGKYNGKWSIFRVLTNGVEEEMYYFELRASNGEKLLSSEEYTSYQGVLRGIETHKANIEKGNFKTTLSKKGEYIFKLLNGKNTLLCTGENYKTLTRCESAIESTKRFAKTAVIDEVVQDKVIKVPVEDDTETLELADGYNGKWIISSYDGANGEKLYYFELFANNGEKLLSSEEYTTYIGAVNGIQTHKTNIEKGNFRISLTKRGDYIYKLLNGNGQLLCLGEHYKTKHRCQNAVESVKRFAKNSPVLTEETNI